jgi:maltooligosyltrehalose trehalohydrolase
VVDHHAFTWQDQHWQPGPPASAVFYELHIGTFTPEGTFDAAIAKLDALVELGITHVELMPVNEFPGQRGWGYDGVGLYAPHHAYGGPDGLKRLVNACHQRGLAVVLDVVYNHLGPSGNYLGHFAPYFTHRYATPWGEAVNFDGPDSPEVRRFFCDNAKMWLRDYHFDGLRLDAVHAIVDTSAIHILEQMAVEVEELSHHLRRHLVLIPESDLNDPRLIRSRENGGFDLHAQWNDDFHHALHARLTGEHQGYYADFGSLADIAYTLQHAYLYDGRYSAHRRRYHGRPPLALPGYRFLGFLQNHDQVGNRALGERSTQLMSTGKLQIGAALVLTAPFIPMLFQGEEWGASTPFLYFTDHAEPELASAVWEGRRREFASFGWDPATIPDPQARETFERSKLDWKEREQAPNAQLLAWHRQLISFRHREPVLKNGRLDRVHCRYHEDNQWLVVERDTIRVVCNLAPHSQAVPLPDQNRFQVVIASADKVQLEDRSVRLPAESVAILKQTD